MENKTNTLNYEASVSCYNNAYCKFEFHADSAELARAHIEHIINSGETSGFDWGKEPGQIHYIDYRKKGNKKWIYVYTTQKYIPITADKR